MSNTPSRATVRILGLPFYNGTVEDAVALTLQGGLVLAPSGPGLASVDREPRYYQALCEADLLLVDSGLLAILWERRTGLSLSRISGLRFLKALLQSPQLPSADNQLWVMPTAEESAANIAYLRGLGMVLPEDHSYLAPHYPASGEVKDAELLARIETQRPSLVILNVAGGKQEVLGAWLKRSLSYRPAIVCTGAAIAFLTGQQACIPDWVDRAKLGWLQRILFHPRRYLPRYWAAWRLAKLVRLYGENGPAGEVSTACVDKS